MEINISEAEWEVMRVVWSNNQVTSKLVIEILKEKKSWSVSTIKTLLSRLVEKDMLQTEKIGNKFLYRYYNRRYIYRFMSLFNFFLYAMP